MTFHLHIRNELWKLFGKKRTYIGFGAFILVQNIVLVLFHFTRPQHQMETLLAGNGYLAEEYVSALTVAFVMLMPQNLLLMPLYASLVGGDLMAKEAEDGTLRMILSRPISRFQLVFAKWLAGLIFAFCLVVVLGGTALVFARLWFPWKGLFAYVPNEVFSLFNPGEGFKLYVGYNLLLTVNATVILSLAFMFSCFNMKPAAATVLALSVLFVSMVLEAIPFFERYQEYLLTHHMRTWHFIYTQPVPWGDIGESACLLLAFGATTFLVAAAAFQTRDIKS
jgi:ABC-2 type transport system permease protein